MDVIYTVTLSHASNRIITINYQTHEIPNGAIANVDYISTSGQLEFQPGDTQKSFAVRVLPDGLDESDEPFMVTISNANDSPVVIDTVGSEVITTLLDNPVDFPPIIDISDGIPTQVEEPQVNSTPVTFNVTLDHPSGRVITVEYQSQGGGDNHNAAATPGQDFNQVSGILTFNPGETSKTVTILVNADVYTEKLEVFNVQLLAANNATIGKSTGYGWIEDVDPPQLQVGDNEDNILIAVEGMNIIIADVDGIADLNPSVNVIYVLDKSGSMRGERIQLLKEAMINLDNQLKAFVIQGATVDVNLILFSSVNLTQDLGKFSINNLQDFTELNNQIANINPSGMTSYTEALYQANKIIQSRVTHYDYTTVLFVSDGDPNGPQNPRFSNVIPNENEMETITFQYMIDNNLLTTYFPFLGNPNITVRAVGIGDGFTATTLDKIDGNGNAIAVTSDGLTNLSEVIENVVFETFLPLGTDTIWGGDNPDILYGDFISDGSYKDVLQALFNGDQQALIDYLINPQNNYENARNLNNSKRGEPDEIHGGAGNDIIFGEGGGDIIYGGDDDDLILGGSGSDIIQGDGGNDTIYGDTGSDSIYGGAGNDVIIYQGGEIDALVDAGNGNDILRFEDSQLVLDLTDTRYNGVYYNFEKIDLGGHSSMLKLNPNDVIEMSENSTLYIDGNSTDTITGSNWNATGNIIMNNDKNYLEFISVDDSAHLLIQDQINITQLY